MYSENVLKHFARLDASMSMFQIRYPAHAFDLHESGFSLKGMTLGLSKSIITSDLRGNTRELIFCRLCDHVTLMPVVSPVGQILKSLLIPPRLDSRHRKRPNGKHETPSNFLTNPDY